MINPANTDRAFDKLVERYLERVFRYLRNLTGSEEPARELAHDTFLQLRSQLGTGTTPTEAYVFTTARNAALSRWRRNRNEARKRDAAAADGHQAGGCWRSGNSGSSPIREVERRELRADLEAALAELPEDQRSVFLLSEVEGLKYHEIAAIMDIPSGTVASRKHHAARTLRAELERRGHALP
jgi:RNA polymerase sigma-70 factor (ECF subfamily)